MPFQVYFYKKTHTLNYGKKKFNIQKLSIELCEDVV